MKTYLWILISIIILIIVIRYFITYCPKQYLDKIKALFKKKKTWVVIGIIFLSPIVFYSIGTWILYLIYGDCFDGYYTSYQSVLYYEEQNYYRLTEKDDIEDAHAYGDGIWTTEPAFISGDEVVFPYIDYWLPKIFYDDLSLPGDKEPIYLKVQTLGGTIYFKREG